MPNFSLPVTSPWRGFKGDIKGSITGDGVGSATFPRKSQAKIWQLSGGEQILHGASYLLLILVLKHLLLAI